MSCDLPNINLEFTIKKFPILNEIFCTLENDLIASYYKRNINVSMDTLHAQDKIFENIDLINEKLELFLCSQYKLFRYLRKIKSSDKFEFIIEYLDKICFVLQKLSSEKLINILPKNCDDDKCSLYPLKKFIENLEKMDTKINEDYENIDNFTNCLKKNRSIYMESDESFKHLLNQLENL